LALLDVPIQPLDDVRTSKGRLAITFLDETIVRLTEHSSLIVDEYVYSNDPSNSKLAINFAQGTARFVTGKLGRIDKRNIKLKTPSADIAIRGTSLAITVTELGSSLIMLLPDSIQSSDDYLNFEDLDVDLLAEDFLDNAADLEFTELDINYLDVNFLEDLLQIIDKLGDIEEDDQLDQVATSVSIKGTKIGQDPDTGIITIVDQQRKRQET
jgi:hypothetical protein